MFKISDWIRQLEKMKKKHGDLPVYIFLPESESDEGKEISINPYGYIEIFDEDDEYPERVNI